MSSESWPPPLKEWVAKCLGQITPTNKAEVQAELKQVISDAFASHALWTTDWAGVQLKSLLPKPPPIFNTLKRKSAEGPPLNGKKAKKAAKTATTHTTGFNDPIALNKRAERFQREHELEKNKGSRNGGQGSLKANFNNTHLFNNHSTFSRSSSPYGGRAEESEGDPNVMDWDRHTIVGTSQEIFKDYLRLTSAPKPETIRPYAVLQKTLEELKKRWKDKANPVSYNWMCNQFKSLRQDLTVQRIKNEFTVLVYEIHARIALECGDMVEYTQCQGNLKSLYDIGIPGKVEEFTAYRILMLLHGQNRSELNLYVGQLTPRQKANEAVQHALEVQRAQAMGNYYKLCELYFNAPNMGGYIMDHFINRERVKGLMVITKSYRTIPMSFLHKTLCFGSLEETHTFLVEHSAATFTNPNSPDKDKVLECKLAFPKLSQAMEEKYRKVVIKGAV